MYLPGVNELKTQINSRLPTNDRGFCLSHTCDEKINHKS